jgi:hypothetical protein
MHELILDDLQAISEELLSLDKDIQTALIKHWALSENRERLLAERSVRDASQPERRRQKRAGNS